MRQAKKSTGRVEDICCLQCLAYATFVAERVVQCSAIQVPQEKKEKRENVASSFLPHIRIVHGNNNPRPIILTAPCLPTTKVGR